MAAGGSPGGGVRPVAPVVAEFAGATLVLRTEADAVLPLHRVAGGLPAEAGRRAVLCAPSVTARPELFEVLLEALTEHLGGAAAGIRLVPLGGYATSVDPPAEAGIVAEWIGQEVAVPRSAFAVPAGDVLDPAPWVVSHPDGTVRAEPPWPSSPLPPPSPSPPSPPPPPPPPPSPSPVPTVAMPAVVTAGGRAVLRTNGGFADLPVRRPGQTWHPPRPWARDRPATPDVAAGALATTPGRRTVAGWSFVDEPGLGGGCVLAGFLVEIATSVTGFRVAGRPVTPRALATLLAACRAGDTRPLVLVPSGVPVRGPAADLLFAGLAEAIATPVYAPDGPVTRTATGLLRSSGTFLRWSGRRTGGQRRGQNAGPVLPPLPAPRARPRSSGPARTDTAVPAAPSPSSPGGGALGPEVAGSVGPAIAELLGPEIAALLSPARWTSLLLPAVPSPADAAPPAVPQEEGQATEGAVPTAGPPPPDAAMPAPATAAADPAGGAEPPPADHLQDSPARPAPRRLADDGRDLTMADRAALRQALGSRYDAHARVVVRTLAQSPGLRAVAGAAGELTTGLVAVRAYCDDQREPVNAFLRGAGPEADADRLTVVARSVAYGLRRLPSVLGPVFQYGLGATPASAYRPGDLVVEPAFLDVGLAAGAGTAPAGTRFVIWSVSARRLDGLDAAARASAIFPPGSRFQVLAVENGAADRVARVLLRDLAASVRGGQEDAERIIERLRAADRPAAPAAGAPAPLSFAPGLDDAGLPFPVPAVAGTVIADEDGRA
ncbi:hypothetical protein [Paractinoplanes hotanensis]|uniref:NAD(+)--protein-arginine ADP-ribosyltransferase n=1 Tax=Paractinoplanes hotanensis TaxID=2906497 RepID=A0ABT0YDA5_9ACTN|nr:hypothetical protein [Actinoplanes hotanensis]MCM4083462.1 hypothetical protein [Actinoplanes hotanensis]